MKSLVIYYSRYGNTELIARAVAAGLSERGRAQALALGEVEAGDLETAHLVVMGAPTPDEGHPPLHAGLPAALTTDVVVRTPRGRVRHAPSG